MGEDGRFLLGQDRNDQVDAEKDSIPGRGHNMNKDMEV